MSVRVGILGCARIAKSAMVDAAKGVPRLAVSAVASRDSAKAAAFAREHDIAGVHGSYEALIADPAVEVIYIPLPNGLHEEWAIRALRAGKGVLCEKPFAANAQAARRMADSAREMGLPLMEALHYRFHPLARFVDEIMSSGRLGRIEYVDAGLEVAEALVPPDDIRFQPGLAGGAMMDLGTYCLSALRWIASQEPEILEAVPTLLTPEIDGAMRARLAFPSGIKGTFQCSLVAPKIKAWLTVTGSDGRFHIDNPFLPQLGNSITVEANKETSTMSFERTPTYVFQAKAFAAVWRGEESPLITLDDSIANMEAIDAIYRAAGLSPRS